MKMLIRFSFESAILLLCVATTIRAQKPESYVQQGPHNVAAMAFSPDSRLLATADGDAARIYDLVAGREVRSLRHYDVRAVAFSPDGKLLATAGTEQKSARSGETPYTVKLWRVAEGDVVFTLSAVNPYTKWKAQVRSLHFSPDGKTLIGGCEGQMIAIWKLSVPDEPQIIKLPSPLFATALSSTGKILAVGSQDQKVSLWDIDGGTVLRTLDGHAKAVKALAFSPDNKILATGGYDYTIKLWDTISGALLRTITGKSQIHGLAFSADGRTLVSASGYSVRLFEVASGNELKNFGPFYLNVSAVAYSPDGRMFAGASLDGRLMLWDSATAQTLHTFARRSDNISSVTLLLEGQLLAAETGTNTHVWDYKTGEFRATTDLRMSSIFFGAGAYSSDYRTAAMADATGGITVVNVEAKKELRRLSGHELFVSALAFGRGDSLLATGGADGIVKIWEAATGKALITINTNPEEKKIAVTPNLTVTDPATIFKNLIGALAFSPDGKLLAGVVHGTGGDGLRLWDTASGQLVRTMPGNADFISAIAFDSEGRRLASGDEKGMIKLWDVASSKEIFSLPGHAGRVASLLFAPDEVLISGGWDAKVKLWDLGEQRELASLIASNNNEWLVIAPDGLFDGSSGAWNDILWRFSSVLSDIVPVELFFSEYFYPNLLADILSGRRPRAAQDIRQKDRRQPTVSLTLAKHSMTTSEAIAERNVTLKIEVTEASAGGGQSKGSGARDLRLFRNGALVRVWRGSLLREGGGKFTAEATLPIIAGENRFTAYVFNDDSIKSADTSIAITGAAGLKRAGTAYVMAIGVNEYENPQFNLKYAVPDAQSFGDEFRKAQAKLGNFARIEVIPLLNQAATKANLLRALARLAGKDAAPVTAGDPIEKLKPTEPEDAVIVYFSGHGMAQGDRFYLIPHDLGYAGQREELGSDTAELQALLRHSISDAEIEQAFEEIDAAQLLFVIDACHSGQALESEEKRRGPMNSKGLAQLAYEKGMYILTASQSYQVAIGSKKLGHGYLTYALVEEGLKTAKADQSPADGQILIREWLDYATLRVPDMQKDESKEIRDLVQPEAASSKRADQAQQVGQNGVQRPRVFYRREMEAQPLIIARP